MDESNATEVVHIRATVARQREEKLLLLTAAVRCRHHGLCWCQCRGRGGGGEGVRWPEPSSRELTCITYCAAVRGQTQWFILPSIKKCQRFAQIFKSECQKRAKKKKKTPSCFNFSEPNRIDWPKVQGLNILSSLSHDTSNEFSNVWNCNQLIFFFVCLNLIKRSNTRQVCLPLWRKRPLSITEQHVCLVELRCQGPIIASACVKLAFRKYDLSLFLLDAHLCNNNTDRIIVCLNSPYIVFFNLSENFLHLGIMWLHQSQWPQGCFPNPFSLVTLNHHNTRD